MSWVGPISFRTMNWTTRLFYRLPHFSLRFLVVKIYPYKLIPFKLNTSTRLNPKRKEQKLFWVRNRSGIKSLCLMCVGQPPNTKIIHQSWKKCTLSEILNSRLVCLIGMVALFSTKSSVSKSQQKELTYGMLSSKKKKLAYRYLSQNETSQE